MPVGPGTTQILTTLATAAALAIAAAQAQAVSVTYAYTLDITKLTDSAGLSPFGANDGVQVIGSVTIDTEAPDSEPSDPDFGDYGAGILGNSFHFGWDGGSYSGTGADGPSFRSEITNGTGAGTVDQYRFVDRSGNGDFFGLGFAYLRIDLSTDAGNGVFIDDGMPAVFDLAEFDTPTFLLKFDRDGDKIMYKGRVSSFATVPSTLSDPDATIPLTSSLAAMLGGLGLGAVILRRRRRHMVSTPT